jgi:hypothetical protein
LREASVMTVRILAILLLVTTAAVMGATAAPQRPRPAATHVIDLLTRDANADEGNVPEAERLRLPFGRLGLVSHTPQRPQMLSLRLLGLDRAAYRIGDPFIYAVLVTNTGQKSVAFPTSTDASLFSRTTPNAAGAFVNLRLDDPMFGMQLVGVQALYGAPNVPASLLLLRSNDSVEIRATGTWYLSSGFPQTPPQAWSRDLQVHGAVSLFLTNEDETVLRSDPVHIQLRKP